MNDTLRVNIIESYKKNMFYLKNIPDRDKHRAKKFYNYLVYFNLNNFIFLIIFC